MKNTIVLEMINNGEIEQLKTLLMEEIYKDSLKGNGNAKSRYTAMKRYFKNKDNIRPMCNYPCKDIEVDGKFYNSFLDGVCFALTTESVGEMETYDNSLNSYFNMEKFVDFSTAKSVEKIDLNDVLAKAKSKGYKYNKTETGNGKDFQYVFKYKDSYYKIGLLDKAFSIIEDGELAEVYYSGATNVLFIKTSIGIAGVLPFRPSENIEETKTIIYVED